MQWNVAKLKKDTEPETFEDNGTLPNLGVVRTIDNCLFESNSISAMYVMLCGVVWCGVLCCIYYIVFCCVVCV